MLVFLLAAIPLAYITVVMLLEAQSTPTRITVMPLVKGALSYALVVVVMAIISGLFPLNYHPKAIYIHFLMDQTLLPTVLIVAFFFLFSRGLWHETKVDRFIGLVAFFAGYYTVAGVVDLFTHSYYFSSYRLFLVPAMRLTFMILIPSGIVAFNEEPRFMRYVYLIGAVIGPFIGAAIAMLHTTNAVPIAYFAGAGFFVVGTLVSYAMVRLYLPIRV